MTNSGPLWPRAGRGGALSCPARPQAPRHAEWMQINQAPQRAAVHCGRSATPPPAALSQPPCRPATDRTQGDGKCEATAARGLGGAVWSVFPVRRHATPRRGSRARRCWGGRRAAHAARGVAGMALSIPRDAGGGAGRPSDATLLRVAYGPPGPGVSNSSLVVMPAMPATPRHD